MISWRRIAGTALILALPGCAAERLHRDGLAAIDKGQYESGVTLLAQAVQSEPHNMSYRLDLEARGAAAVQRLDAVPETARGAPVPATWSPRRARTSSARTMTRRMPSCGRSSTRIRATPWRGLSPRRSMSLADP